MAHLLSLVVAVVVLTSLPAAQQGSSLKGAWRVVEVTTGDGKTNSNPEPGLYIFTERHYSIMRVTQPRAPLSQDPTVQEKVAAFDPFMANSGSYEVTGNQLVAQPMVAKHPNVMTSAPHQSDVRFEGATTVYLTGPAAGGLKATVKLQRLE